MTIRRALLVVSIGTIVGVPVLARWVDLGSAGEALIPIPYLAGVAFVVWFVSARVPADRRSRVWHGAFAIFFSVYVVGLVLWLVAGLVPAFAHHLPSLHDRLHTYGGAPDLIIVGASEIAPFSVEGSRRIREMTMREGAQTYIELTNSATAEGLTFQHNISIRETNGTAVFVSEILTPSPVLERTEDGETDSDEIRKTFVFTAPPAGTYEYRCDIHLKQMSGTVRVLPAAANSTSPGVSQGLRDLVRRMAEVSHQAEDSPEIAVDYLFSVVGLGLGVFLYILRPRERMARIFAVAMVGTAAAYNLQSHAALAIHSGFDWPLHASLHPLTGIMYIYALVLFPDGRLVPRWSNRYARLVYRLAVFVGIMVVLGTTGSILPDFGQHPAALVLVFGMIIPLLGMVAQTYRIRRASESETRQQSRLLAWALLTSFALGIVLLLLFGIDVAALTRPDTGDPTVLSAVESRAFRVFQPLFVVIPVALFAGILRYRLWDIDLVINKTLVYGALAGFIGALYVGIVVMLGGAVGGRTGLSIAATVVAAVAFDPLRSRVQRLANGVVYGDRASPYEVMADVSRRLSDATSADDVLPTIAETAGRALAAERTCASMSSRNGERRETVWPAGAPRGSFDRVVTVMLRGEPVGEIGVAKRPGDALRPADNRLLDTLAAQAGIALEGVALADQLRARVEELRRTTRELAASRRRILTAQDAERSRLEREIHDRVERGLVEIGQSLIAAERALPRRRSRAVEILDVVGRGANEVQEALRDVARGIFPPLLADKGVVSALESQARKFAVPVVVRASDLPERFDARAEAAVYFCCIEALRPAASRSNGPPISVEVAGRDGWITFVIRDQGHSAGGAPDSDFQLLADRVEAVGGKLEIHAVSGEGRTISGRVPAHVPVAAQTSASRSGSNADFGT